MNDILNYHRFAFVPANKAAYTLIRVPPGLDQKTCILSSKLAPEKIKINIQDKDGG